MEIIYVFLTIGGILLAFGIGNLLYTIKFLKNSKTIEGVVQKIKKDSFSYLDTRQTYAPVIKYFDEVESKHCLYESTTGYSKSRFNIGDKVQLRYYRNKDYKQLRLNTWLGIWGFSFVFLLVGTIFTLFSIFIKIAS